MSKKLTTEEFVVRANKKHEGRYDYSKVVYKNIDTKVEVICPEHGSFWQTPYHHLTDNKCPACSGKQKLTKKSFTEKANKKHNCFYDYSKVKYKNNKTKIEIICPEHGSFWQTPTNHLSGQGCIKCGGRQKLTTEEFIARANKKHGNRYDYSKVCYKNNSTKIEIICKEHGSFWQRPANHLNGSTCPVCSGNQKSNTEEFIGRANGKHGDKYDYSKVEYKNNATKVEIICKIHGSFWQVPNKHFNGQGCPVCAGKVAQSATIFRKLAIISEIEPFTYQFIQEFTGFAYSTVVKLCREYKVRVYKKVLIKETFLYNNIEKILSDFGIKCEILRNAKVLNPYKKLNKFIRNGEIDIYIPDLKLGFEFNGVYWHRNKPKGYHMEKYNTAKSQGITLFHIWEDEYSCEEDIDFWNEEIMDIIWQKNLLLKNL